MRITLAQFDDFAEDAQSVRAQALEHGFSTETGPDGLEYTGICQLKVPQWEALLAHALGRQIAMRMAFFRINLEGEFPHSWVHSDNICAEHAGLLYLNPPGTERGGTAFWRHAPLRIEETPSEEALKAVGTNPEWFTDMLSRETKDLRWWEMQGFVPMKWNRLITYPTSRFHSRYPFEGFGVKPEDARLVWTCFYDLL